MTLEQREHRMSLVKSLENIINKSYNCMNINVELEFNYSKNHEEYVSIGITENYNSIVTAIEVTETNDLQLIKRIVSKLLLILE